MKININFKSLIILSITALFSCSTTSEKDENPIQTCDDPRFIVELTEYIPAQVAIVKEGEPFFNGIIKTYYEVDAETYLPELYKLNNQKIIRIFPMKLLENKVGDKVEVTGKLSSCHTGNHGLLTNDYNDFIIIG